MICPLCESKDKNTEKWLELGDKMYLHCSVCDLVWLREADRLSSWEEKLRYEKHENSIENKGYVEFLSDLAKPVFDLVHKNAKGLDYGCGTTRAMELCFSSFSISSYDPFFFPDHNLTKNSYDFLLCSEVVEHFSAPKKEFELFQKCLNPGGILGISSMLRVEKKDFSQWWYRRDPTHISFYSEKTVQWIAGFYSMKIVELDSPLWIMQKRLSAGPLDCVR